MDQKKTIGLVFIDEFADWEFGLLSGSAVEWFGARAVALAPTAGPLRSIGGLHLVPDRGLDPQENADLDAVAVIGANTWPSEDAPDIAPLLHSILSRGGIVGGICGGTLALARAGVFEGRRHTSNGAGWIQSQIGDYADSCIRMCPMRCVTRRLSARPDRRRALLPRNFSKRSCRSRRNRLPGCAALLRASTRRPVEPAPGRVR